MEPSTVQPEARPRKPSRWWVLIVLVAGAAGGLAAIAAGGNGTYTISPFEVELRAQPAALGKTELAVQALEQAGSAEAGTHAAPIEFRATVVDVADPESLLTSDRAALAEPRALAEFLSAQGRAALRSFAIKLAVLAVSGGAGAGLLLSFGRWRRVAGGAAAGLLVFAVIGLLVAQTYDKSEFAKTRFVRSDGAALPGPTGSGSVPTP